MYHDDCLASRNDLGFVKRCRQGAFVALFGSLLCATAQAADDFGIMSPSSLTSALRQGQVPFQQTWENASARKDFVVDELIVGFDPADFSVAANAAAAISIWEYERLEEELAQRGRQIAQRYGLELIDSAPNLRAVLYRTTAETAIDLLSLAGRLNAGNEVLFAEPNSLARTRATEPTDSGFAIQDWHYSYIGAERGWDTLPRDFNVRVAVIDTGYRFDHPDATVNASQTEDYDFVRPGQLVDCNAAIWPLDWDGLGPDDDATDDMQLAGRFDANGNFVCSEGFGETFSHGTHVANTIVSGWNNGQGGVGVFGRLDPAPAQFVNHLDLVSIRAADVQGSLRRWDAARALQYAAGMRVSDGHGGTVRMSPVDIVNMSYDGPVLSIVEFLAVNSAWSQGVLMVGAAGNEGTNQRRYPAGFNEVIAVSNLQTDESLNPTSSFGPHIELTAPGTSVSSNSFDYSNCSLMVPGLTCTPVIGGAFTSGSRGILQGTSMAAPHVAGVAALYLAHNPTWNNLDLRLALQANAADWGQPAQDDLFGFGIVQTAPGRGVQLVTKFETPNVFLVDATSGLTLDQVEATPMAGNRFSFHFAAVPAGDYYVLIATDEDGDGRFGETGEPIGAVNGLVQNPGLFRLPVQGDIVETFAWTDYGWPDHDPEPGNDSDSGAGMLPLGFYVQSTRDGQGDQDWYRVRVPWDGNFRVWTEGMNTTLCREELGEYDPVLEIYDATGGLLASNDDPVIPPFNIDERCAEIVLFLAAGEYLVKLTSNPAGVTPAPAGRKIILHFDTD